jgi:murein DD-endopeptidase MepM/ murein hydrolase activator NlpD
LKRFAWILLLLVLAGAAAWLIYERQKHEVIELRVPGHLAPLYVKVAEKHGLPWQALAAVDEVEIGYRKVNQRTMERRARELKEALNGEKADPGRIRSALARIYSQEKASRMAAIMEAYEWEAAPLAEPYAFPFRKVDRKRVSYVDSWGNERTYGGKRKHEGTDLMTRKGTPVVAVTDGEVVRKGWDRLGGWRLLIRDGKHSQIHYYYAHLSRYADGLEEGDEVKKGQVVGYVGDSGYGPEGTTGQFPPHLHFGMYVSEGILPYPAEAVNPYPFLRVWDTGK